MVQGGASSNGRSNIWTKLLLYLFLVMIFGTQKVSAIVKIPKFAFYEPPYCTLTTALSAWNGKDGKRAPENGHFSFMLLPHQPCKHLYIHRSPRYQGWENDPITLSISFYVTAAKHLKDTCSFFGYLVTEYLAKWDTFLLCYSYCYTPFTSAIMAWYIYYESFLKNIYH